MTSPATSSSLHDDTPNTVLWSRANLEEAAPGVLTPLSWSFWQHGSVRSSRAIYSRQLGAITAQEARAPVADVADKLVNLYFGRIVVNVDQLRRIMDRVPGADPDALELQVLGRVRPEAVSNPTWRRLPAVLARVPVNVALLPRRVRRLRADTDRWWRGVTAPGAITSLTGALAVLQEALDRFVTINTQHGFCVFVGQGGYDQLVKLCAAAGHPGLELQIAASGRGTEETAVMDDLWRVADGVLTVEEFVAHHGYHGPDEGELSSVSWREDPSPVLALSERYRQRGRPDAGRPESVAAGRAAALATLRAALPVRQRASIGPVVRFLDVFLPLREVGKAAFVQSIDAARHAARVAGDALVAAGALERRDDVFYLTWEELLRSRDRPLGVPREQITARHAERAAFERLDIPDTFVGVPEATARDADTGDVDVDVPGDVVTGLGASPGVADGTARVVTDPYDIDALAPGEILVCELTDPGWTPFFHVAAAVVIDIGGPLSHGAIVARELGIPAVINTGDGTRRIPDGAKVRVDGAAGTVELLS